MKYRAQRKKYGYPDKILMYDMETLQRKYGKNYNNKTVYNQRKYIINNLAKKYANDNYSPTLAPKLYEYLVKTMIQEYFQGRGSMNPADRKLFARMLARDNYPQVKRIGESLKRKKKSKLPKKSRNKTNYTRTTITDMKIKVSKALPHYFSKGNMRMFGTKIHGQPYVTANNILFISSEDQFDRSLPKLFSVNIFTKKTGKMNKLRGFGAFKTKLQAEKALKAFLAGKTRLYEEAKYSARKPKYKSQYKRRK